MSNNELTEDMLLIQQISARYKVNREIIARIRAYNLFNPITFTIMSFLNNNANVDVSGVQLLQHPVSSRNKRINGFDLLENPKSITIHQVEDFFNDKLNYSVEGFQDLERLNNAMLPIAKKYEIFGPTPKAIAVLKKFQENYDTIQVELGKIEGNCIERESARKSVAERVAQLNKQYKELVSSISELQNELLNKTF